MRRLRWVSIAVLALSATPDALFAQVDSLATRLALELNVPAFRLDVRRDSALVRSYPVSVGQRIYPTPLGEFQIQRIVWNPWWQPPESEWAAEDTLTPPGPRNPMGKVKLFFDPMYYLHGTPSVSSIGTAASHGCVRMRNEDAMDLARFLQSETSAAIDSATLLELVSSWNRTERVDLPVPVPVSVIYRLIEVRDTMLYAHRDIYRQRTGNTPADALVALAEARRGRRPDAMTALAATGSQARLPSLGGRLLWLYRLVWLAVASAAVLVHGLLLSEPGMQPAILALRLVKAGAILTVATILFRRRQRDTSSSNDQSVK